jgi:predicted nucleic-acid-binding protein
MIGLDTNVVVRYLVQDDPKQSKQATQAIEKAAAEGKTLAISQVTLCEIVWVLERCYSLGKKELVAVIKQILKTQQINVEQDTVARQALHDFEEKEGVDFSDCLIGRQNAAKGCAFTYTLNKKAAQRLSETFKALP